MKTSRKRSRFGSVMFFIPVVAIGVVVVFAIASVALAPKSGSLVVRALAAPYNGNSQSLVVQAAVDGRLLVPPATLSVAPGSHTVAFGSLQGYRTPANIYASVQAGQTYYATGIYDPLKVLFEVTSQSIVSLNTTSPAILHGVTPVVWVNTSSLVVTIQSTVFGLTPIPPGGNFTHVFPTQVTCRFWIFGNSGVSNQFSVS